MTSISLFLSSTLHQTLFTDRFPRMHYLSASLDRNFATLPVISVDATANLRNIVESSRHTEVALR
jgi:hypothetical protein